MTHKRRVTIIKCKLLLPFSNYREQLTFSAFFHANIQVCLDKLSRFFKLPQFDLMNLNVLSLKQRGKKLVIHVSFKMVDV